MIVVSDTSPLTYLIQIGELSLLQKLYSEVIIPAEVFRERQTAPINFPAVSLAMADGWIRIQKPLGQLQKSIEGLDAGETEAITLALELKADLVLMDERLGTIVARKLHLRVYGLVGVLVLAKQKGLLISVKPLLDKIISYGFRISPNFYTQILSQINE